MGKKWDTVTEQTIKNKEKKKKLCWMREASHKRPSIMWVQLYEVSRRGKSVETESGLMAAQGKE